MRKQLKEVKVVEKETRKGFEAKLAGFLKTLFQEEGVVESFKRRDKKALEAFAKMVKMLFVESAVEEALEKVLPEANVSTKRKLYGSPDKALGLFTVITSRNKPVGYFADLSLVKGLDESSDLLPVLTVLNTLALEAYKENLCKEDNDGVKISTVALPASALRASG